MPSPGILHFLLQIVRILDRLFAGVLHQARIAAEGICIDDVFFFHGITSLLPFHGSVKR